MAEAAGVFEDGVFRKGDVRLSDRAGNKILPIGNDRFASVAETSVFIDKTMLIADVLDKGPSGSMRERTTPACSRGWPYGTPAMDATGPIRALIRLCGSRSTT